MLITPIKNVRFVLINTALLQHILDIIFPGIFAGKQVLKIKKKNTKKKKKKKKKTTKNKTKINITKTSLFKYIENFTSKKTENFQVKNSIFHISAQNIDCGYSLEPPRRGSSNEYPQSMFLAEIRKIMYTPVNPSFTI